MDERINIKTRKMADYTYQSVVRINGEIYAEVRGPSAEHTLAEAQHYAMQIEFDEEGNW